MHYLAVFILLLFWMTGVEAEKLYTGFPEKIMPEERYVIYSHGLILEGNSERPEHPDYGIYEFQQIKDALFEEGGFNLIAHHRAAGTDIGDYTDILEMWVIKLVESGVKPSRITLIGFSRGSHLTAFASSAVSELNINTALLASCMEGDIPFGQPLNLGGNLLSIYETSDVMGSCSKLAEHSSSLQSFAELAISTGETHGAFFRPHKAWVVPLKAWIKTSNR